MGFGHADGESGAPDSSVEGIAAHDCEHCATPPAALSKTPTSSSSSLTPSDA